MDIVATLKRLSEASGVSGYEDEVREMVQELLLPMADEVRTDTLGNVIAVKEGVGQRPRPAIMIASHMDEIGLVVSSVEKGFVHFERVGGFDDRILLGQEVLIHGRSELPGIIGAPPPHVLSSREKDKPIPYDKLLIDAGLCPEEAQTMIRTGDLITMRRDFVELEGGLVSGKALDNRASVAACAVCMEELQRVHHDWDVYAVATTQEEVGLKGAITSAYGLEPDVGIAVDVTWADQPGAPEEYTYQLGKGPTIACGPNFHPRLQEALVETARALEMSYHVEPVVGGGSDAWAIQVTREGIPTALLSIPLRNMHSPVETVSIQDIKRVGRLLAAFVGALDGAFLDGLAWKLGLEEAE